MSASPFSTLSVKTGKAQNEQMFSGLPPTADIGEGDCHVSVGPQAVMLPSVDRVVDVA
jgi:hypothetical protein